MPKTKPEDFMKTADLFNFTEEDVQPLLPIVLAGLREEGFEIRKSFLLIAEDRLKVPKGTDNPRLLIALMPLSQSVLEDLFDWADSNEVPLLLLTRTPDWKEARAVYNEALSGDFNVIHCDYVALNLPEEVLAAARNLLLFFS